MALFMRKTLQDKGLNAEQIDYIMTESNRKLANDYLAKDEVQERIDAAVLKAQADVPAPNVAETDEYKALQGEFDTFKKKVELSKELKNGGVKEKFIDQVFALLEDGKPTEEQLGGIREKYEEYFNPPDTNGQAASPQFGADVKGTMPSGKTATAFEEVWGLGKK